MSNHLHLVVSAVNNDTSDMLRDFKKFTSKQIIKAIADNGGESRKEWMLKIFASAGTQNSRNANDQFWRQDNHPVELYSEHFTKQKIHYIYENPVVAGIVDKAVAYLYSSAKDYYIGKNCGLLTIELL